MRNYHKFPIDLFSPISKQKSHDYMHHNLFPYLVDVGDFSLWVDGHPGFGIQILSEKPKIFLYYN